MLALEILHLYLTDTAVSPLQRDFIQIEHPICADVCCRFIYLPNDIVVRFIFNNWINDAVFQH